MPAPLGVPVRVGLGWWLGAGAAADARPAGRAVRGASSEWTRLPRAAQRTIKRRSFATRRVL